MDITKELLKELMSDSALEIIKEQVTKFSKTKEFKTLLKDSIKKEMKDNFNLNDYVDFYEEAKIVVKSKEMVKYKKEIIEEQTKKWFTTSKNIKEFSSAVSNLMYDRLDFENISEALDKIFELILKEALKNLDWGGDK